MLYLRVGASENNILNELNQRNLLNLTKREKLNLIYGPYDYYERAISELEKLAETKGYNSLQKAREKNKKFLETENLIENKFISYVGGEIYLFCLLGGAGFISLFY